MLFLMITAVFATATASAQSELNTTTSSTNTTVEVETTTPYTYKKPTWGGCRPRQDTPPHGQYKYIDPPYVEEGQVFDSMVLEIVCDPGYGVKKGSGFNKVHCDRGVWSDHLFPTAECELYCKIPVLESVEFRCPVEVYPPVCHKYNQGGTIVRVPCPIPEGADQGYRTCKEYEPKGTEVQPVCKSGYHGHSFVNVTCSEGKWHGPPTIADIVIHIAKERFSPPSTEKPKRIQFTNYDDEDEMELIVGDEVTSWACSRNDAGLKD